MPEASELEEADHSYTCLRICAQFMIAFYAELSIYTSALSELKPVP